MAKTKSSDLISSRPDLNLVQADRDVLWDGCSLTHIARIFGTPCYVINPGILRASYHRFLQAFDDHAVDAKVFFSLKTNPVPEVLDVLAQAGCGAEVVSLSELTLAIQQGLAGERIIVNGVVKPDELLETAIKANVTLINIDNADELRRLHTCASRLEQPVNVGLRIRPKLRSHRFDMTLASNRAGSPSGFIMGSTPWREALHLIEQSPYLQLRGLQFHLGSGIGSARPYEQALAHLLPWWQQLRQNGFPLDRLDIGGGFNAPTLSTYSVLEMARIWGWGKAGGSNHENGKDDLLDQVALACKSFTTACTASYTAPLSPDDLPTIIVEPGRAIVAASQLLILQVQAIKQNEKRELFAFCDGGAMSLSPMLWTERHAILPINKADSDPIETYTLRGNMPAPFDIVAFHQQLPRLQPGNLIAILDVGAYFTSFANTFAGSMPAIAMIDPGKPRLIRSRNTAFH